MEAERSIIKKFRKEIWTKFAKAVGDYQLINENDRICVCISGGKDSFLLAKCIQELQKHGKVSFEAKFLVMNPGYNKANLDLIKKNAKDLKIDLQIYENNIFEVISKFDNPCYLCARKRRGSLYSAARELNCNKIALGHHFDDVIETTLLSMFYASEIKTMMPKLHSTNYEGMELIRPLYLIKEDDIIEWAKYNNLKFLNCACPLTEDSLIEDSSKRKEIKNLIKEYKKINPQIDINIFRSMSNVYLDTVLEYKRGNQRVNFLDNYDQEDRD